MRKTTTLFPYLPTRPEWKDVPFAQARELAGADVTFIGHDSRGFHFEVRGRDARYVVR